MQRRSATWKRLFASGDYRLETKAVINGTDFFAISAPVISRAACSEALSVGNCVSATLQFSVMAGETEIPKSAEVEIRQRLANDSENSEWMPAGTFFISKRSSDAVSGLITLECYDAMLKANASYPLTAEEETAPGDTGTDIDGFPKSMVDCIQEVAKYLDVAVDDRTWYYINTGFEYAVTRPTEYTMKRVLSYIAALHGGNWIITPANRLRFVPLLSSADAEDTDDESKAEVIGVTGKIGIGGSMTISGVRASNGTNLYEAGTSAGETLKFSTNPYATQYITEDLYEKCGGLIYRPFRFEGAIYDPAAELGDYVIGAGVRSVLYSETATLGIAFRGDISAPFKAEVLDEYPYVGTSEQFENIEDELLRLGTLIADKASITDLTSVNARIDNLSANDIKTGIIHSYDYDVERFDRVYPGRLYPSSALYPSNAVNVLQGFAIDFSTGTVYGAFYSTPIAELQQQIAALNRQIQNLQAQIKLLEDDIEYLRNGGGNETDESEENGEGTEGET